jgi:hypothetical protein
MREWAKSLRENRARAIAAFLWAAAFCGCALLAAFVTPPSESESQVLFGLSRMRLVIAGLFLFLLLLNVLAAILFSGKRGDEFESGLALWMSTRFTRTYAFLFTLAFLTGTVLLFIVPPLPMAWSVLKSLRPHLPDFLAWFFLWNACLAALLRWLYAGQAHGEFLRKLDRALLLAGIFLSAFFFYEHFAREIGWFNRRKYSYWHLLAAEFIEGRLYLHIPPPNTHDLTLYEGRWYVPLPPVPAVVMMPLVRIFGVENFNSMDFSIFFSAANALLVFLVIEQFIRRGWLKISIPGALWLVLLFMFGTPHLWVGINGRVWFISQVLTVTFLALAVLGALHSQSPWLLGLWIGLAVGTRPNGLMTLPFVFAITVQIWAENGDPVSLKRIFAWALRSAVPIGAAILGLLYYNYARFEDFLDFGYVSIHGHPDIVHNAQTYGLFSTHYIPENLKVMFLYAPEFRPGERWFLLPSTLGMSVFLVTPALLYLFRRYENKTWVWGAWAAVILNFALLVMYHNTGRDQFGYRYILDVLLPLTLLLASAFGKKSPWHFILLVIASIAINMYGADWFFST